MFYLRNKYLRIADYLYFKPGSAFLHTNAAIQIKMLYTDGDILWFDDLMNRLLDAADQLDLPLTDQYLKKQYFLDLVETNRLSQKLAMIKLLCVEEEKDCEIIAFAYEYKPVPVQITAALHPIPNTSPLRKLPLQRFEDFYWKNFYAKKYDVNQVLFTNYKMQVIGAPEASLVAIWNKNLYIVHPKQPYYESIAQEKLINAATKIGIKKVLTKNKGFPLVFLQRIDELMLIDDLGNVLPITLIFNQNGTKLQIKQKQWAEKVRSLLLKKL